MEGWPAESWATAGERFQSDKMYKAAFKAARNVRKSLGLQQMPWAPPSQVNSIVARTRTVYSEIGFLSESELTKICGVGSKALKLSPGKIFLEDKNATLTGFYVSLLDMPAAMVNGVRKIRLEWSTTTEHVAIRLHPDRQIMQDQGQAVFNFCTDQALEKMGGGLKSVNRAKLQSVPALIAKAEAILKAAGHAGRSRSGSWFLEFVAFQSVGLVSLVLALSLSASVT